MAGVATYEAAAILAAAGAVARIVGLDGMARELPIAEIFGKGGLLVEIAIPDARSLTIAADRSFREYLVVVRASRPGQPDRFAVGGLGPAPNSPACRRSARLPPPWPGRCVHQQPCRYAHPQAAT